MKYVYLFGMQSDRSNVYEKDSHDRILRYIFGNTGKKQPVSREAVDEK